MEIPIQNIYYLLCYAWNQLEEKDKIKVEASDYKSYINLFARIHINGCGYLFKRGLDREYLKYEEIINGVKGKIDLTNTLKRYLHKQAQTYCIYDELDYNVLHNQIILSTIKKVLNCKELYPSLKVRLREVYSMFKKVDEIKITSKLYNKVKLHRNNQFYKFILNVTRIINENISLDEKSGTYQFLDFTRDEKKMALLFESFVRNFYRKEQTTYKVGRELINWDVELLGGGSVDILPVMQTDISLESSERKIIIDTKYYKETLTAHHGKEILRSEHLNQIFAYLDNVEAKGGTINKNCSGILLYPTVRCNLDESFRKKNHIIRIKTINLIQEWKGIEEDLLKIIEPVKSL